MVDPIPIRKFLVSVEKHEVADLDLREILHLDAVVGYDHYAGPALVNLIGSPRDPSMIEGHRVIAKGHSTS
jgi:hypothetical protein